MKKVMVLLMAVIFVAGCGEKLQSYIDNPRQLIRDPEFANYEYERDELESSYLSGEIDYPEYLNKKKELDEGYAKDVLDRERIIHDDNSSRY